MSNISAATVAIYYNKTCYGLSLDANILEKLLKKCGSSGSGGGSGSAIQVHKRDMNEPPIQTDIAIHLECPVAQVMGFSHCNILMINSEQWISNVYDPYIDSFDLVFVRSRHDRDNFVKELSSKGYRSNHIVYIPWSLGGTVLNQSIGESIIGTTIDDKIGFVSFIGKNKYKYEWLRDFLQEGGWANPDFPALRIYTSQPEYAEGLKAANQIAGLPVNRVQIECRDLDSGQIDRLQWLYQGHLLCSRGEGFGYAAAEAEAHGAKLLLSELPVFKEYYSDCSNVAWLPSRPIKETDTAAPKARRGLRYNLMGPDETNLCERTKNALTALGVFPGSLDNATNHLVRSAKDRQDSGEQALQNRWAKNLEIFRAEIWTRALKIVSERRPESGNWHCPPVLVQSDCPPITIVTPTRNRRKLIDIAFHNILSTDYPLNKIEWIVIEDSDTEKGASDRLINFQMNCRSITLRYIPLQASDVSGGKVWTIGEKRNIGVEHASHDIILFMDDDDHYPPTSFRRRVAWLQRAMKSGRTICGCSTLALYDLLRGISAVNVPPWDIPQCQRISEATLGFSKTAWLSRKFPEIGVAEGEDWIRGRENEFMEIPPQQIIVAFSHGENSTSRRVPALVEPNGCFWGFPREYLQFVHGLVGVGVEGAEEGGAHLQGQGRQRQRAQAPSRAHVRNQK